MNWLLANSLVAAAMALLVLLAGRCKLAPSVMHGLWLFVLLKMVTPPLFSIPVDVSWFRAPPPVARTLVVPLTVDAHAPVVPAAPPAERSASPMRSPTAEAAGGGGAWWDLALAAWACGSAAMLAWFAVGLCRGHRRLRALGPVPPAWRREIEALAARLGVRVPVLRDDPAASSPYVWSFGRTCLVVPVRTLAAATAKGRAAVLVHELAHLRRGDHWLAHAELLLAVGLWWHPLFWFARARLRLWAELACDAWAVASVPEATIDYATVLVQAVASPDHAVPAPAVLAARPAARAAFERRLTMILNENVPCRASRAWWLPFTSLALGLFTVPVAAQHAQQDPVHVEIRVNGKKVDELSAAERKALLQKLQQAEAKATPQAEPKPADADANAKSDRPAKKAKAKVAIEPTAGHAAEQGGEPGAVPPGREIHESLRAGLEQARAEIAADEDLRELGITDEVTRLIDDIAAGKGMGDNLDAVVKAAMKGAGKMVTKELAEDEDLRKMGLTDGITKMVLGFLENERTQELMSDFVRRSAEQAMKNARHEIHADAGLRELGITAEVEGLLDCVLSGKGNFDVQLQGLIDKSLEAAKAKAEAHERQNEVAPEEPSAPAPAPAPKKKAKKAKLEPR